MSESEGPDSESACRSTSPSAESSRDPSKTDPAAGEATPPQLVADEPRVRHRASARPRLRQGWVSGLLVSTLLVLLGAAVGFGLQPGPAPSPASSRLVPVEASRGFTTFSEGEDSAAAMVENALLTGPQTESSVPQALWQTVDHRPSDAGPTAHWWREGVVVTGFSHPAQRYRMRLIGTDGVRLAGQEWGALGIAFSPALLELPGDVHAGQRWTSQGRALADPTTRLLGYANSSSADQPPDRADAAAGCLQVRSTTTLQPEAGADPDGDAASNNRWTEINLWCPDRGVVASSGNFRGTAFAFTRLGSNPTVDLTSAALTEATAPSVDPRTWKHGPLRLEGGDDTFGDLDGEVSTSGHLLARDSTGAVHVLNSGGRDVNTLTPLDTGQLWAHGWLHPGGSVTGLAATGRLVVTATSERRLHSYDYAGRLHWSAQLPDLAVTSPVVLPHGRLLVATISGDVLAFDTRTGAQLWRQRVSGSIDSMPSVGDGVVLIGTAEGSLIALNVRDGVQLWQRDVATVGPQSVITDGLAVSSTYGQLQARDVHTGTLRWSRTGLGATDELTVLHGSPVVLSKAGARSFRSRDGTPGWRRQGEFVDATDFGDASLLLGRTEIIAVDGSGATLAQWPLASPAGPNGRLLTGPGQVWAIGSVDATLSGTWVGPVRPGPV